MNWSDAIRQKAQGTTDAAFWNAVADEIERNRAAIAELVAIITEYIAAADYSMCPTDGDDVAAMLRFADADNNARVAINKHSPTTTKD